MTAIADVREAWSDFLVDIQYAENYHLINGVTGGTRLKNPALEQLSPTLLHVKAVANFDFALETWLAVNGISLPPRYRGDLNGRIKYFSDNGHLSDAPSLHDIRRTRNSHAHDPLSIAKWKDLHADVQRIHDALFELKIVDLMPTFKVEAIRHKIGEPLIDGAIWSRKIEFIVEGSDGHGGTIEWFSHTMKGDSGTEK